MPDWLAAIPPLPAVFVTAFVQSLGIPLHSVLVLAPLGLMVGRGELALWQVVIAFISGQTLGDLAAYGLSRGFGPAINRLVPRLYSRRDHPIVKKLLSHGPGPAIFLSYALSLLRPVMNYLAPVLGIPILVFLGWSLLRNCLFNTMNVLMITGGVGLFIKSPAARPWLLGVLALGLLVAGWQWWRSRQSAFDPHHATASDPERAAEATRP